ncbi:reverse transcriptase domain-containing protein [Tanacetum coccineum]
MHTRASNSELVEPLPEPERILNRRRRRRNRRVPFDQRNNPPKNPRIVYPPILNINHFRHFLDTLENLFPMDDEPMWAADRVVALTPGSAITIPETANEFAIKGTLLEEEIFAEFDKFMAMTVDENYDSESNTKDTPFEKITINIDYKIKTSIEEPPTDLKLKPLPDNLEYVFLEEPYFLPVIISSQLSKEKKNKLISILKKHKQAFAWKMIDILEVVKKEIMKLLDTDINYPITDSPWVSPIPKERRYFQILIDPNDQEKTTFTCPFEKYAYRRMPFGLCNAPATFQRCMLAIFHDMIEESVEVFMDDLSVFGNSVDTCLNNLDKMLQRCKDAHLVLNWEKCHFMVKEGIVLGHKVSSAGLEVDKAKIDVISKLPPPTNIKGIRSFLGHAGFYRRFIKDFSKIARALTKLLKKDTPFGFNDECQKAVELLKEKLTCALVIVSPNWNLPFELMCNASNFAVGAVLGQRDGKNFHPIYFASKTLNSAQ